MIDSAPVSFLSAELQHLRARPRISTYDWTRANLRLVSGPFKGHLWNPDISPQARGVMDAFDRPHVRKLYYIAPSQSTKSTTVLACFLAELTRRSDLFGVGLPDQEASKRYFSGRLHAYFERVPALRALLAGREPLQNHEINMADGACVYGMWSGSESRMRSDSMPLLLIEEEDAYLDPAAAQTMEERAEAYHALELSKIVHACRPKGNEDQSVIWAAAKQQAQAWCMYEARCPACWEYQLMEHNRIEAVDGSRDAKRILQEKLGRYRCPHCNALWSDSMRNMAVRGGRWTAVEGDMERAEVLAFHSRSWESTLVSLSDVLAKWFNAQGNPRLLQFFDNNECAKPYKFVRVEVHEDALKERIDEHLPNGAVPDWALALTLSADMQQRGFYFSVAAHGLEPERLHVLDYGQVGSWADLQALIFDGRWKDGAGKEWGIWRAGLDTGGTREEREEDSRTKQAYLWLQDQRPGVVFGTKGMSRTPQPGIMIAVSVIEKTPDGVKLKGGQNLHLLHTDAFKRLIFWRLGEGCEEEPITFHADTGVDYLKMVASERLEKDKGGREIWKKFRENHYLDCLVGHVALSFWQWAPSLRALAANLQNDAPVVDTARIAAAINPMNNAWGM